VETVEVETVEVETVEVETVEVETVEVETVEVETVEVGDATEEDDLVVLVVLVLATEDLDAGGQAQVYTVLALGSVGTATTAMTKVAKPKRD
ncbi:hypothetical protein LTS09_018101, partial [Friedmanniomyces endolithicus]